MREQVVVLPPSNERRKAAFSLSKNDESLLKFCKESRKLPLLESENAESSKFSMSDSGKDLKGGADVEFIAAEKMMQEDARNGEVCSIVALRQETEEERQDKSLPCTAPLLQWGQRKRSRCSRMDNHNLKPCNSPAASFCKAVRVPAEKPLVHANPPTSKGALKAKNSIAAEEHLYTGSITIQPQVHQEETRKQAKVVKNGPPNATQERKGPPTVGSKRGCPSSAPKQEHQKKACTMSEHRSPLLDSSVHPNVVGEANPSMGELVWPKFVIGLSRKEKEEDFLIFKGTKLPQRPRRRPKAVERILHYCLPGSWLVDMSHSRYDVREKKRAKKKPRGLKAMESFDSDLE